SRSSVSSASTIAMSPPRRLWSKSVRWTIARNGVATPRRLAGAVTEVGTPEHRAVSNSKRHEEHRNAHASSVAERGARIDRHDRPPSPTGRTQRSRMPRLSPTLVWLAAAGMLSASSASADLAKLDPRARVALDRLRAGAPPATLAAQRAAVRATGELDVFVVGPVSRAALEAAGARVRTEAGGVFTAWVPPGAMSAVAALPGVRRIEGAVPVEPTLDVS